MLKKTSTAGFLILCAFAFSAASQTRTLVNSEKAKNMLLGRHKFSLQWISWDYFGQAAVTNKNGVFYLKGEQRQRGGSDVLKIDGVITEIDEREFKFKGSIVTQVSHINEGAPCVRLGEMTFRVTGKRRYWRLAEMDNPCDPVTDYVDIYFK